MQYTAILVLILSFLWSDLVDARLVRKCKAKTTSTAPALVSNATSTTHASASTSTTVASSGGSDSSGKSSGCFPSLGFKMPSGVPSSLDNWWCDPSTEYAFVGFSYEVSACQSRSQLTKEFKNIRAAHSGRYVRLYGACDKKGFYDDVVEAAWEAGVGVHALVWFGFDGGHQWETRRDSLVASLHNNPKAKFVTRVVQFGSEPLFDSVLSVSAMTSQVKQLKAKLADVKVPVTVSELAFGYTKNGGAQGLLDSLDSINAHILPFFSRKATKGADAWPLVQSDLNFFIKNGKGKKIYMDENGWPSVTSDGVSPNSGAAVASVSSEQQYFNLLDSKCSELKKMAGGVAWFAHIYSDDQEPGYGIYSSSGKLKFPFNPKTHC